MWKDNLYLGIILLLAGNVTSSPTEYPAEVVITCAANSTLVVGALTSISLERQLGQYTDVRYLVTLSDETGPQLEQNAILDLAYRNPNLQGYFQRNDNSSFFTLTFDLTESECAGTNNYTCVMTFEDTNQYQTTVRENAATKVNIKPSNVSLSLHKVGTTQYTPNMSFNVGDVVEFYLDYYSDPNATINCFETHASDESSILYPFSPSIVSSDTSSVGDCNFLLSTAFNIEITEDDLQRRNDYIVQCSVTSGTTEYSNKIYLDFGETSDINVRNLNSIPTITSDPMLSEIMPTVTSDPSLVDIKEFISPEIFASNSTCTNTDGSYICTCNSGFTGDGMNNCTDIDECMSQEICANNSTCTNTEGSYTCTCNSGFTGDGINNCTELDSCSSVPCQNGGTCSDFNGSYTCTCLSGYTGNACNTDINECMSPGICTSNSTCTNIGGSYTCTCSSGFTGDGINNCTEIDSCSSAPCQNGGTCSDFNGSYTCACYSGYTGSTCDTEFDSCSSAPCQNGGTCSDFNGSYTCMCLSGYTGNTCDTDINECMSAGICTSNSTCTNTGGSYICTCNSGFTGDGINNCTELDSCASAPCQNGGTCSDFNGSYTCTCLSGYTGTTCDTDINECMSPGICTSNSTCTNTGGSYTCTCNTGFTGDGIHNCTELDSCASAPCQNGGTCSDSNGSYTCMCYSGYTGNTCDTDINECMSPGICTSNSTCTNTGGSYTCMCNSGFTGDGINSCTELDSCSSSPCQNGGTCSDFNGSYTCACLSGYTGTTCDTDINECMSPGICTSNSTCTNTGGSYTCTCNSGFTGDGINNCTELDSCASAPCQNGGTCSDFHGSYTCMCYSGYTGSTCDTELDSCASAPCQNGGTCSDFNGSYTCMCYSGYTGSTCDTEIDSCASAPCQNGGTCSDFNGSYTCMCYSGYTGSTCDTDINECMSPGICTSNSTCTNTGGSYTCMCNSGFTGDGINNCTELDSCASAPCQNGGTCSDFNGSYTCLCLSGYTGSTCDTDINECMSPGICTSNSTCTNTGGSYTCMCNSGFTGDGINNCTELDSCTSVPCQNGGTCSDFDGSYICWCYSGYTGSTCDIEIDSCSSAPCHNGGTCSVFNGSYTCTCLSGYTGTNCDTDINECISPGICTSNSTCTNTGGSYICTCNSGFTGDGINNCTEIDGCVPNPCQYGNCIRSGDGYSCTCNIGHTGATCDIDIDECSSQPCKNYGICQNTIGSFRCYCTNGWTGPFCEDDVDECVISPCATNAECSNTLGSFTCSCRQGFTGDGSVKCSQTILLDVQKQYFYRSDDNMYSFYLRGGIEYYGKRYYYAYVSMNGYMVLGRRFNSRYPWSTSSSWRSLRYPIIAPLWTDIDTSGGSGDTGMYINLISSRSTLDDIIRPVFEDSDFKPTYCLMVTWKDAAPYPYRYNHKFETADFQVLLATNNSFTYAMFNYDQDKFTWRSSGGRLVAVGHSGPDYRGNISFTSSNFANVNKLSNVGKPGRWRYEVNNPAGMIDRAKALCRNWYYDVYVKSLISYAQRRSNPCPCSLSQIRRDWRYSYVAYRNGIYHYRQRWSQWPYSHRQRCHYKRYTTGWWWSWRTRGYLLRGYPGGGYMESYDSRLGISDAYDNCCVQNTGLCHLFHRRNPSKSCSRYRPPSWRPANGDPHITTLDGARYTFNGRGEFTLVEVKEENTTLTVQVRTDFVTDNDPDATIFVGVAGKDGTDGDVAEVILDRDTNSSNIYINGNYNASFASSSPESLFIEAERVTVFNDSDKLVLAFESGLSVQVSVHNLLDIITSSPEDGVLAGTTRGLLGNNDGDINNDFMMKNGTILSVNSTEEQLFDFGLSWMIDESESLFDYTINGKPFEFYNNLTIRPRIFIGDMLTNLSSYLNMNCPGMGINASAIEETCADNVACKVDAAATCDLSFGKASKTTEEEVAEENEVLENFPPNFTAPGVLYIGFIKNKTATLDMNSYVTDSNLDVIGIETNIPEDEYSFESNIFQWEVSEEFRLENKTVYLRFTANDTMGASSEYWPDLYYCGCHADTECEFSLVEEDNDNEDHFYRARCNCSDDRDGIYCENIKDRCDPNPCYENVTCDSTKADNPCGECPAGLNGDGLRCEDTNECNVDPSPCNQTCDNIIGSYICSCNSGYILDEDQHNCDDIDECGRRETNDCGENEECKNVPGSYRCHCAVGYAKSGENCEKVTSSFVGIMVFETVSSTDQTITSFNLDNLLFDGMSNEEPRVASVEVFDLRKESPNRRKRDWGSMDVYIAEFIVYSADSTLGTADVVEAFVNYRVSINDSAVVSTAGSPVQIWIKGHNSKIYGDDEYGLCDIPDKVTCDLETTICTTKNGVQTCTCKEGFEPWRTQYVSCKDVDECNVNDGLCGEHGICENTIGDYQCDCHPGYREDETRTCVDICASTPCQNGGTCTHLKGQNTYSCQCQEGWIGFNCDEEENSDAERMKVIAIVVGSTLGIGCIVLLAVSIIMIRQLKVNSKIHETKETSVKNRDIPRSRFARPSSGNFEAQYHNNLSF